MSTRANIILKDSYGDELVFYRHSDGYPSCCGEVLNKFCELGKADKIRNNVSQASGWLILLGAVEYKTLTPSSFEGEKYKVDALKPTDWKCGAFEPTTEIHGDIDYLYIVDLNTWTVDVQDFGKMTYKGKYS